MPSPWRPAAKGWARRSLVDADTLANDRIARIEDEPVLAEPKVAVREPPRRVDGVDVSGPNGARGHQHGARSTVVAQVGVDG